VAAEAKPIEMRPQAEQSSAQLLIEAVDYMRRGPPPAPGSGSGRLLIGAAAVILISLGGSTATSIGIPGLLSNSAAAEAKVIADALVPRVEQLEKQSAAELAALRAEVEANDLRIRRTQGQLLQWIGDTQIKQCAGLEAIAAGISSIAPRGKAIEIDCDPPPFPPELLEQLAKYQQTVRP
jgi:hypothetical protein